MRSRGIVIGFAVLTAAASGAPIDLDNGIVRARVDPAHGGSVVRLVFEKAAKFPLIAERGAGVAGSGTLFSPVLETRGISAGAFAMDVVGKGTGEITLRAALVDVAAGLTWTRRIKLSPSAARLTIEDELASDSDRSFPVRIGWDNRQQAEPWRLTDRFWIGSERGCALLTTSDREPAGPAVHLAGRRPFWRQIGPYGTGYLCRIDGWPEEGRIAAAVEPGAGEAVGATVRSPERILPARGKLVMRAEVAVDEGGGAPDQDNALYPVLIRADFAHAGLPGQPVLGFATLASPEAGRFVVTLKSDRELMRRDVRLEAGEVVRIPASFVPAANGECPIEARVSADGREMGRAHTQVLVGGDDANPIRRRYRHRFPEEIYRGTWEEIGEQLVKGGQPIGIPTAMPIVIAKDASADNGLAYYDKAYPDYADLIRGVAKASGAAPNRVFLRASDEDPSGGCLDAVYYGPDGPINAFSKERYEGEFHGEGYVKVIPDHGYAFHYFEYYGVNSVGLSISGAACCEDWHTHEVAIQRLEARIRAGGHTLPAKAGMWLIYATCRTVDEALRIITNPDAPLVFTGNMMLVDRSGQAARVESVGIEHQVFRHGPGDGGVFAAGNYLHQRSDGLFGIGQWSWSANSMLRERFLAQFVGDRQGRMSLEDVFSLMQTHEAGGICQHHHDNPARLYTCCSYIAVPGTSELWLAAGPPCEVGYVRYSLEP